MTTVITAYDDQKIAERAIAALREEGFEDRQVQILSGDLEDAHERARRAWLRGRRRPRLCRGGRGGARRWWSPTSSEEKADRVAVRHGPRRVGWGRDQRRRLPREQRQLRAGGRGGALGGQGEDGHGRRPRDLQRQRAAGRGDRHPDGGDRGGRSPLRRSRARRRGGRGRLPGEDHRDDGHRRKRSRSTRKRASWARSISRGRPEKRQETVRDTVRRTEVEVEQVGAAAKK